MMGENSSDQSFEENYRTLETFSQDLQQDKVSVDQLVPRMKEALGAVKVCKNVLKETQSQLEKISNEFSEIGLSESDDV
jgi:exodeoxyribonuclease VII small subunit